MDTFYCPLCGNTLSLFATQDEWTQADCPSCLFRVRFEAFPSPAKFEHDTETVRNLEPHPEGETTPWNTIPPR